MNELSELSKKIAFVRSRLNSIENKIQNDFSSVLLENEFVVDYSKYPYQTEMKALKRLLNTRKRFIDWLSEKEQEQIELMEKSK